jgi:hypothetical protein
MGVSASAVNVDKCASMVCNDKRLSVGFFYGLDYVVSMAWML